MRSVEKSRNWSIVRKKKGPRGQAAIASFMMQFQLFLFCLFLLGKEEEKPNRFVISFCRTFVTTTFARVYINSWPPCSHVLKAWSWHSTRVAVSSTRKTASLTYVNDDEYGAKWVQSSPSSCWFKNRNQKGGSIVWQAISISNWKRLAVMWLDKEETTINGESIVM